MFLESDRLPSIVQDVSRCSNILHNLIQTTTLKILQDIEEKIVDQQSMFCALFKYIRTDSVPVFSWLGAEKMTGQSLYDDELKTLRADQACEFILEDTSFINWYHAAGSSGSRQLVILGEMGCGKTVTMAFIVEQLRQRKDDQLPNPKICYYYCRDDETGKELAILSVLILSLLQQLPGLKKRFSDWYKRA
jgi:Cdc6-like AAA superfamily ATPase